MKAKVVYSVAKGCWDIEVIEGNPDELYVSALVRELTNSDQEVGHLIAGWLEAHNPGWEIRLSLAGS